MNLTSSTFLSFLASVIVLLMAVVIVLAVWVYAIVDCARTDKRDIRLFTKEVWLAILVLGSIAGAVAWFTVGRPRRHD